VGKVRINRTTIKTGVVAAEAEVAARGPSQPVTMERSLSLM
jgi:hypothetical protein